MGMLIRVCFLDLFHSKMYEFQITIFTLSATPNATLCLPMCLPNWLLKCAIFFQRDRLVKRNTHHVN